MQYIPRARTIAILSSIPTAILLSVVAPLAIKAASDLHPFSDGEVIDADVMNGNFTYLEDQMSSLDDRIGTYETVLTVDAAGNVGVGTSSPQQKLSVAGTALLSALKVDSDGSDSSRYFSVSSYGSDGVVRINPGPNSTLYLNREVGTTRDLHIMNGNTYTILYAQGTTGNVGIGTTSPAYALDVSGKVIAYEYLSHSDARLKTDITPIRDALEGIRCLEGVTYRWKDPEASQDLQVGLIAQDVEQCFPEVVSTDDQGMKSVAYDRLVAPLIEAVKAQQDAITRQAKWEREQQRRNAEQATRYAEQEKQVAAQQQRVSALEAQLAASDARLARLEAAVTRQGRVLRP